MEDNNIVNVAGSETVEEVTDLPKGSAGTDEAVGSDANQSGDKNEAVGSEPISDAPGKETAVVKKVKERIKRDAAQIAKKKRNEELIKKLLAENKELEKSVKSNRNKARNKYGMMIYAATYVILGLTAKEKACQTEDDFADLKSDIEDKLKGFIKLEKELSSIESDDTIKKLAEEIEVLNADNEKLVNERDEALKVKTKYNDVDLTQFDCFVPTVFTIASRIGLRDEMEKCKTVEEYRNVVGKILGWINVAVNTVNNVQNDVEEN